LSGPAAKRCSKCKQVKALGEFGPDSRTPDGHRYDCRECKRKINIAYRNAHLDQERSVSRERTRVIQQSLRAQIFAHYGETCICCGTDQMLCIDHVDGDGPAHRRELFGHSDRCGHEFYRWLIQQGFPDGYQTLCSPCNVSKRASERCSLDHQT
jgi:hypothetical protein